MPEPMTVRLPLGELSLEVSLKSQRLCRAGDSSSCRGRRAERDAAYRGRRTSSGELPTSPRVLGALRASAVKKSGDSRTVFDQAS